MIKLKRRIGSADKEQRSAWSVLGLRGQDFGEYRNTSLIRNSPFLGSYSRTISRVLLWSSGGGAVSYERGTPVGFG